MQACLGRRAVLHQLRPVQPSRGIAGLCAGNRFCVGARHSVLGVDDCALLVVEPDVCGGVFLCRDTREQNRYVARLVSAQIIATTCFMLFPLHFGWPKPPTNGLSGWLFDSLVAFDLPYNQAPSLHIALVIIVGAFYWTRFPKIRLPLLLWQSLIALSVLTTYQHHFIDVPTGALLGWLVLWAIPQHGVSPFRRPFGTQGRLKTSEATFCEAKTSPATRSREIKIAMLYLAGAVLSALPSLFGGAWLWMLWVSVSLSVVAFAYLTGNAAVFQKQADGRLSAAATVFTAALSGGRAAEHGVLAARQGEDGAGS